MSTFILLKVSQIYLTSQFFASHSASADGELAVRSRRLSRFTIERWEQALVVSCRTGRPCIKYHRCRCMHARTHGRTRQVHTRRNACTSRGRCGRRAHVDAPSSSLYYRENTGSKRGPARTCSCMRKRKWGKKTDRPPTRVS